jgi:molybdopterin converting factor small subunit
MPTISIPTPLRPYAGDTAELTVSGGTVGEALQDLVAQHPDLASHLYNEGQLRSFVNIFIGDEDIRYMDGEDTTVTEGDKLKIIPSIAGGIF